LSGRLESNSPDFKHEDSTSLMSWSNWSTVKV